MSLFLSLVCVIGYGVLRHFQQYFNYIVHMAISFMGGGNLSTQRKPPTCRIRYMFIILEENMPMCYHA
jgi:hypothetical protein